MFIEDQGPSTFAQEVERCLRMLAGLSAGPVPWGRVEVVEVDLSRGFAFLRGQAAGGG